MNQALCQEFSANYFTDTHNSVIYQEIENEMHSVICSKLSFISRSVAVG